jgi:hypothetical protein
MDMEDRGFAPQIAPSLGEPTPTFPASAGEPALGAITVLASYAHQDDEYNARVLAVVQRLRQDRIDCWSDHFVSFPKEGWPLWMERELTNRRWVLVFASESYKRRAEGNEHGFIRSKLYEAGKINERFLPVGFGSSQRQYVPQDLRDYTYFNLDSDADYEKLLSVLREAPLVMPHSLSGSIRSTAAQPKPPSAAEVEALDQAEERQRRAADEAVSHIRPHEKSERRYQLERLAFTRLYHLEDATVPAVRLVGAATEHFPIDTISVALASKYAMPEPFAARRAALVAALEAEVSQRGGSVFNGPSVRMSDYTIEYPNVASERKHLKLVLSRLEYYDYAVMRRVSDAAMLDGGAEKLDSFLDVDGLVNTGSVRSNRLSNIVDTATTIVTKDGALLYSKRTQQVGDRGGWFTSAVAETLHAEKDQVFVPDARERRGAPYRTVVRGIAEELSPELADVARRARLKPLLLGISFDLEGFHPDLLFLWLTELRAGEVLTSIRNHPGKDFFEGRIRSLDMSMGLHDVVRALTSERWTPGGAASVVRGLEFLAAARARLGTKDLLSAVKCLLEEGIGALDEPG